PTGEFGEGAFFTLAAQDSSINFRQFCGALLVGQRDVVPTVRLDFPVCCGEKLIFENPHQYADRVDRIEVRSAILLQRGSVLRKANVLTPIYEGREVRLRALHAR